MHSSFKTVHPHCITFNHFFWHILTMNKTVNPMIFAVYSPIIILKNTIVMVLLSHHAPHHIPNITHYNTIWIMMEFIHQAASPVYHCLEHSPMSFFITTTPRAPHCYVWWFINPMKYSSKYFIYHRIQPRIKAKLAILQGPHIGGYIYLTIPFWEYTTTKIYQYKHI